MSLYRSTTSIACSELKDIPEISLSTGTTSKITYVIRKQTTKLNLIERHFRTVDAILVPHPRRLDPTPRRQPSFHVLWRHDRGLERLHFTTVALPGGEVHPNTVPNTPRTPKNRQFSEQQVREFDGFEGVGGHTKRRRGFRKEGTKRGLEGLFHGRPKRRRRPVDPTQFEKHGHQVSETWNFLLKWCFIKTIWLLSVDAHSDVPELERISFDFSPSRF